MDEQPVQLVEESVSRFRPLRSILAASITNTSGQARRAFACSRSLFRDGERRLHSPSKTKVDWATEIARLLDSRYKKCEKVILVCDNLNTHTIGAFYEAFKPGQRRRYVRRIDFCHTPKHGSWLNIGWCQDPKCNVLSRQFAAASNAIAVFGSENKYLASNFVEVACFCRLFAQLRFKIDTALVLRRVMAICSG